MVGMAIVLSAAAVVLIACGIVYLIQSAAMVRRLHFQLAKSLAEHDERNEIRPCSREEVERYLPVVRRELRFGLNPISIFGIVLVTIGTMLLVATLIWLAIA
jgi:hypothetical protein